MLGVVIKNNRITTIISTYHHGKKSGWCFLPAYYTSVWLIEQNNSMVCLNNTYLKNTSWL